MDLYLDQRFLAQCVKIFIIIVILEVISLPRRFCNIATLEKICNGFWILENIRSAVNVDTRILQKV